MARTFRIARNPSCGIDQSMNINNSSLLKSFFGNQGLIGKIGDIEILNDIGLGKTGHVLRTLASVSDSLRIGTGGPILGPIIDNADAGANWVLGQFGITESSLQVLKDFHPNIVNNSYGQAKALFEKIKQGNFTLDDIPEYFQDFQNLDQLIGKIFTPGGGVGQPEVTIDTCATPWAMDLISYAPKYKFLFVVEFTFSSPYQSLGDLTFAFVVKQTSRPMVQIEHEDINYYNFRTKVAKKITYKEMDIKFYDDDFNQAFLFYTAYLKAMSPIANVSNMADTMNYEQIGLDPTTITQQINRIPAKYSSASLGILAGDVKTVLTNVRLYHIYRQGRLINRYNFINPRIEQLGLDDVDMSLSEGNEVSITFNYDALLIDAGLSMDPKVDGVEIAGINRGGRWPMIYRGMVGDQPVKDPNLQPTNSEFAPVISGGSQTFPGGNDLFNKLPEIPLGAENITGNVLSGAGLETPGSTSPFNYVANNPWTNPDFVPQGVGVVPLVGANGPLINNNGSVWGLTPNPTETRRVLGDSSGFSFEQTSDANLVAISENTTQVAASGNPGDSSISNEWTTSNPVDIKNY